MARTLAYAWYRFSTTLRSEVAHLVLVVVIVGLLGGLALGAVAAGRSTESSFTDYAAASHVPQLYIIDGVINPTIGLDSAYNAPLLRRLAHLPHVTHVASTVELNMGPVTRTDHPLLGGTSNISADASVNGLNFTENPLFIVQGRMADPSRAHEFVADEASAKALGYHLGQVVTMGWATNAQINSGNFTPQTVIPADQRERVKLVGIAGGQATSLFQDQDAANSQSSLFLFTPALTNKLLACCSNDMLSALTLQDGNRYLAAVENEVRAVLPRGLPFVYIQAQTVLETADQTLRPEAIALGVFGGIAGAATLLIAGQLISRRLRLRTSDLEVLRGLGANPSQLLADGLVGTLGAVVLGCVLSGLVALALSPLAPLGPVRPFLAVEVHPDWAVIGLGVLSLMVALSIVALVASWRALPWHTPVRTGRVTVSARVTSAAAATGLPPAGVAGVRFALEPGAGRSAVPVRSALLGAVLAVTVVVATVTFGSSLDTLVSHPALYGWNWTYDMDGGGGQGDIPGPAAAKLLNADPLVSGWTGVYYSTLELNGVNVPVMGSSPHAAVEPPLLSGHGLDATNQVVLGAATLRQLHAKVGDTVDVRAHSGPLVRLTIVGTATLPPIGVVGSSHLEMGSGAVLDYHLIPPADRDLFEVTPGPNAILVRTKGGESPQALHSLQAIGRKLDIASNGGSVLPVQRPAQILDYSSLGATPVVLGFALAAGAAAALAITLVTSVRRRRRDLAILKILGFTGRELAASVAIQATVPAVIGCAVGIPLGIAVGRYLWDLFAGQIDAVPLPTVPAGTVTLVGLGAIVLAVLVAAVPGRLAARTRPSHLLRVE
jgi:MacB-like periplasmic core domain/FtsX-like permease family